MNFPYPLISQSGPLNGLVLYTSQVADLVVNSPELCKPQQKESLIFEIGISSLWICWIMVLLWINWLSLYRSHIFCDVMKLLTLAYGWLTASTCRIRISRRLRLSSQLSNQNRILSPFPNFHLIPCRRSCLQRSTFCHTREFVPLLVYSRRLVLSKYLACMDCTQREDSLFKMRQANLHWKTH